MMMVKEYRVRYQLETAMGHLITHAVICKPDQLQHYLDRVKETGYILAGVDRRLRDEDERLLLDEGWQDWYNCDIMAAWR